MYKKIRIKFEQANKTLTRSCGLILVAVKAIVKNIFDNDWKRGKMQIGVMPNGK